MLNNFQQKIFKWVDQKSTNKLYPFYLTLFLMSCSLFFAMPDFHSFDSNSFAWQTVQLKSVDLTNTLNHVDPHSWLSKKVFRLTVPFIMRVTHLDPAGIIVLQYILGFLSLVFCYKLAFRITEDRVVSTFVAAGIVFIYFGRAGFYDLKYTWFDGFAFFSLIMAMYCRNIFLIFLFSFSAAWSDERGFIALSIIFLFHQHGIYTDKNVYSIINLNKRGIAVSLAIVAYIILRLFLSYEFNMNTNSVGANLSLIKTTAPYLIPGIWTFLEGFWLLYIFALVHSFKSKLYSFSFSILLVFIIFIFVSSSVTDITRSGSYMAPVIFILLGFAWRSLNMEELRKLLLKSAAISFIFPALIVCPDWGWGDSISSVFLAIYRHLHS